MGIKVGLLGLKGEFSDYKTSGTLFYRYMYYTYTNMMRLKGDTELKKIEPRLKPSLGKGLSIMFETLHSDISEFDVVHNFDLNPFFPKRNGHTKIVTTAHDFQKALAPQFNKGMSRTVKDMLYDYLINKLAVKTTLESDYIIAVSSATRDDCVTLGFDKSKIFVINHGIDETFLRPVPKKGHAKFTVGYMGAMPPRKNPMFLLNTFRELQGDEYSLQIWGKLGYEREKMLGIAKGDKRIEFRGFAPDDKFVEIYDSFDVFLFPSHYEGFGIPIIEAQARGLPVITLKGARIPDETRKYCFEAEDEKHAAQLIKGFKEKGYKGDQMKKAMEYARSFTWEKTARETLEVYKRIAESKSD